MDKYGVIICLYVDGLLIFGTNMEEIYEFDYMIMLLFFYYSKFVK